MPERASSFLSLATERPVRQRALRIALIVGSVLAVINHWDKLLAFSVDSGALIKIGLTFLVPYCVSTYSSVLALQEQRRAGQSVTPST